MFPRVVGGEVVRGGGGGGGRAGPPPELRRPAHWPAPAALGGGADEDAPEFGRWPRRPRDAGADEDSAAAVDHHDDNDEQDDEEDEEDEEEERIPASQSLRATAAAICSDVWSAATIENGVWAVIWLVAGWYLVDFWPLWLSALVIFLIYKNTGKGPRTYEEGLSAYSIFNPNLERIEGDISLHELEGQIRSGGGRVPTARGMGSGLTRLLEEEEARDLQRALELSRRDH